MLQEGKKCLFMGDVVSVVSLKGKISERKNAAASVVSVQGGLHPCQRIEGKERS